MNGQLDGVVSREHGMKQTVCAGVITPNSNRHIGPPVICKGVPVSPPELCCFRFKVAFD